jgi:hypothetical protein
LARKLSIGAHPSGEVDPCKADARKVEVNISLCGNRSSASKRRAP